MPNQLARSPQASLEARAVLSGAREAASEGGHEREIDRSVPGDLVRAYEHAGAAAAGAGYAGMCRRGEGRTAYGALPEAAFAEQAAVVAAIEWALTAFAPTSGSII